MDYFNFYENSVFDLNSCDHIIGIILSFLTYDELVTMDLDLQSLYRHYTKTRVNQIRSQCLLWRHATILMKKTRNLTISLYEDSPIAPEKLCTVIQANIKFDNITALNLNISYRFNDFNCPLAMYGYDFTYLTKLRHLSITNALLEFIQVKPQTLNSLILNNIYLERNTTSFRDAFNNLMRNAINLRYLHLDKFPENFITKAIHLEYIAILPTAMDVHALAEFLFAHRFSLKIIRLNVYGLKLINLLRFFKYDQKYVFPNVHNLIFHFNDLFYMPISEGIFKLPICKKVFPNLNSITFAINNDEQLQTCISFCIYRNLKDIILRPTIGYDHKLPHIDTEVFTQKLQEFNNYFMGTHTLSFIQRDIAITH